MIRRPDPVVSIGHPIAWTPTIALIPILPTAGYPIVIHGRLRTRRSAFETGWRIRKIVDLVRSLHRPEARDPLISTIYFGPVARYPLTIRWDISPYTANPDEVITIIFPRPITGNPLDVVSCGLNFRRNFVDGLRRGLRDYDPRLWVKTDALCKRFM
jgi:hypothetical protein